MKLLFAHDVNRWVGETVFASNAFASISDQRSIAAIAVAGLLSQVRYAVIVALGEATIAEQVPNALDLQGFLQTTIRTELNAGRVDVVILDGKRQPHPFSVSGSYFSGADCGSLKQALAAYHKDLMSEIVVPVIQKLNSAAVWNMVEGIANAVDGSAPHDGIRSVTNEDLNPIFAAFDRHPQSDFANED